MLVVNCFDQIFLPQRSSAFTFQEHTEVTAITRQLIASNFVGSAEERKYCASTSIVDLTTHKRV